MTTVAQVKQVVQPLLQSNPDLALVGRMIVVKPVHHLLRGVYLDRSSDPDDFVPTRTLSTLFQPEKTIGFSWGGRVHAPDGKWDINDASLMTMMCEQIEKEALPPLRSITTIDEFVKYTSKERFPHEYLDLYDLTKIFVDVARGDLASAGSICNYLATDGAKKRYLTPRPERYVRATTELCPLIAAKDRVGLARLLHSYEAESAKNLKLDKLWEPTPFPIEMES